MYLFKRTDYLSSFKSLPIITKLIPGLNKAHMWSFCSNSQHESHFPNKILLEIKSALPNIKTSINQKCNVCFTVCEKPNKSFCEQFKREGVIFPNGCLISYLYFQLSCWEFSSAVYLGWVRGRRKHLASANGRQVHREKLMASSFILKKICFLKIYFLMIFWTGEAMHQQRSQ